MEEKWKIKHSRHEIVFASVCLSLSQAAVHSIEKFKINIDLTSLSDQEPNASSWSEVREEEGPTISYMLAACANTQGASEEKKITKDVRSDALLLMIPMQVDGDNTFRRQSRTWKTGMPMCAVSYEDEPALRWESCITHKRKPEQSDIKGGMGKS